MDDWHQNEYEHLQREKVSTKHKTPEAGVSSVQMGYLYDLYGLRRFDCASRRRPRRQAKLARYGIDHKTGRDDDRAEKQPVDS